MRITHFAYRVPTDKEAESYLDIHNVGIESYVGEGLSRTVRPNGRKDYLLLYTHNAKLQIKAPDGTEQIVNSHCVLYKPSQPQDYALFSNPDSKLCWIHFNGISVIDILREAKLYNHFTIVQKDDRIIKIFEELIITLQRMELNYKMKSNSLFLQLLYLLSNNIIENSNKKGLYTESKRRSDQKKISPAIAYINENLDKNFTLEDLAKICLLSKTTFAHIFPKVLGVSPIAYIINRKLESSLYFLLETDASIQEISEKFGFESPFYYSKRFKQQYGLSPSEYRKKTQL